MGDPCISAQEPAVISPDPGSYYWCSCGRSRDQPFCDGSHEGTGCEPVEFTVDEKKEVALCSESTHRLRRSVTDAPDTVSVTPSYIFVSTLPRRFRLNEKFVGVWNGSYEQGAGCAYRWSAATLIS
jgi:hypothetical protein